MNLLKRDLSLLFIPLMALTFLLASCESRNNVPESDQKTENANETESADLPKDAIAEFREAMAGLPPEQRITVFDGLTPEFKSTLWRNRISTALNSGLSEAEKSSLLNVVAFITPELYTDSNYMTKDLAEWESNARATFGDNYAKLKNIVSKIDDTQPDEPGTNDMEEGKEETEKGGAKKSCECSTSSDWCAISMVCKRKKCKATKSGCGTLGRYACNGLCVWKN